MEISITTTFNYGYPKQVWPHHSKYSVTPEHISTKEMRCYSVQVSDWSGRRLLYVDHNNRVLYLQITNCNKPCSICEKRMQETGVYCKDVDEFATIGDTPFLYRKMPASNWSHGCAGEEMNLAWLKSALWYAKEWREK